MDSIDIRHRHSLTRAQARKVVDTLAQEFSDRVGMGYRWDDDTFVFSRFGLRGFMKVAKGYIHIKAQVGFLYLSRRDNLVARVEKFLADNKDVSDPKAVLRAARRAASVSPSDRPTRPVKKRSSQEKPSSPVAKRAVKKKGIGKANPQASRRKDSEGEDE